MTEPARCCARATHGGAHAFHDEKAAAGYPYPFGSAAEMLRMGAESGKSIAEMKRANEAARHPDADARRRLDGIWEAMDACIDRGLRMEGELPGGLKVRRAQRSIHDN
jgi:L-serine dehydratase